MNNIFQKRNNGQPQITHSVNSLDDSLLVSFLSVSLSQNSVYLDLIATPTVKESVPV